ncbi:hypothetical protein BDQ12DRAFT_734830 [Crucibulum laeve]|uniref:F-box domain-containing protein n=1 Tax=Crucibulum laeve TaxID=68775 RepID=A0A5C3M247_9AGAR|nr:hypothetical protein BDQ12DRAFT_734830 [Crucibulum laeve]
MPAHGSLSRAPSASIPKRTRSRPLKIRTTSPLQLRVAEQDIPSPQLPIEIIDRILELAVTSQIVSLPLGPTAFKSIVPFTLTSTTFRHITLRHYFRDLLLENKIHWDQIYILLTNQENKSDKMLRESRLPWIRSLCSSSSIISPNPERLSSLTHLEVLSIDFQPEGLSTQHPRLKMLFHYLGTNTNLTSLILSTLPRIDVKTLQLIAETFPRLVDLYLSCTERLQLDCCWICFEDSLSCTGHSPIPDEYTSAEALGHAFALALKPLRTLTRLHLGIFLCDEQLPYSHIDHSTEDETMGMADSYMKCDMCEEFRRIVHRRELSATIAIAQHLKILRSIGWSSFFGAVVKRANEDTGIMGRLRLEDNHGGEIYSDTEELEEDAVNNNADYARTTVWILRTKGRIRVKKSPWDNA